MNAVVKAEPQGHSVFNDMAQRFGMDRRAFEATLRATVMKDATNEQAAAFLLVAKKYDLNPFTREIFAFPAKGGGIQPVVSVDGWLRIINSHPDFDGMEFVDQFDASGNLSAVTCKMHRKDRSHPTEVTEYMSECRRGTDTWKQWPARMLRHKATIQAARYAFGFSGIMEPDEAERAHDMSDTVPQAIIVDDRKRRHDDALEQYQSTVDIIKDAIRSWDETENPDDLWKVAEEWRGIPSAAQIDLWLAPTKGGCFTTHERDVIKTKLPRDEAPEA